jgi:hypothetical protein
MAAFGVEQAIAHGTYIGFTVVDCILLIPLLLLLHRLAACRLVVTPSGLDIVNLFKRYSLAWDDIAGLTFGDELPRDMPLTYFADDRHVVVKTTGGKLINVAALTLGRTPWDVKRVHRIVTKLDAEASAHHTAETTHSGM